MSEYLQKLMRDCADSTERVYLLPLLDALSRFPSRLTEAGLKKVLAAYDYAAAKHGSQKRDSGDPYITHPVAVAVMIAELGLDFDAVCAALLHDTVEDTEASFAEVKRLFGADVCLLVEGMTKLSKIPFSDKEGEHVENIRNMFLAMSRDIRVIFVKLCDRLHNMRTLGGKKDEAKRRVTALETMNVYAPIAHRLGMQTFKSELEDLSIRTLDPFGYKQIEDEIAAHYGQKQSVIESAADGVKRKFAELGFNCELESRVKSVYSVYRKMFDQNKTFEEIFDFYAMRVICKTELECYTVLGAVHDMFHSIPGRFKDYISNPKPNGYRSIHTTVIGGDGVPFEVQIRTEQMHHVAEYGIAAHWKYKEGGVNRSDMDDKLGWIAKVIEADDITRDPDEYLRALKVDLFHDETFVFTPKGDVVVLPEGATLIDFAYAIHSGVGNRMVGAKINGNIAPIHSSPENGQIIEIITGPVGKGPSRDWLKVVKTAEAKNKIRQYFKKEKRPENIALGRADIEREFKHFAPSATEEVREIIVTSVAAKLGITGADDLYNTVGYGGLTVSKIVNKLRDEYERYVAEHAPAPAPEDTQTIDLSAVITKPTKNNFKGNGGIIVDGEDGCDVKYSKCCNPLPGDLIEGFSTKGHGISIHKSDCPNLLALKANPENADRFVAAHFDLPEDGGKKTNNFDALIAVYAYNRTGLLADITTALSEMHVDIRGIEARRSGEDKYMISLTVACRDTDHYKSIVAKLRAIDCVYQVERGFGR